MIDYNQEIEQPMNNLIQAALQQEYCGSCPNKERVERFSFQGIYPRWGAGSVIAPIVLIFERPGNQHYLCELGRSHTSLAQNINLFRQNYSEIMYSGYSDGVRYLEAILLFIYGRKSLELSYHARITLFFQLVYITELVKCPGSEKGKGKEINAFCPEAYLRKEWSLLQQHSPLLVISTTHLMSRFPTNFPSEVHKLQGTAFYRHKGVTYLKVHHPAYISRFKDGGKLPWPREWTLTAEKHKLPIFTDLRTEVDIRKSVYLLHQLESLPNARELQTSLKSQIPIP